MSGCLLRVWFGVVGRYRSMPENATWSDIGGVVLIFRWWWTT